MKSRKFFFLIFVLGSLGFIAYGLSVYIQDRQSTTPVKTEEGLGSLPEQKPEDAHATRGSQSSSGQDSRLQQLNEQNSQAAKNALASGRSGGSGDLLKPLTVSFSAFSDSQGLNLGLTFVAPINSSDQDICTLSISDGHQTTTLSVSVLRQSRNSGCRFNQVDLGVLQRPTRLAGWEMTLGAYNDTGEPIVQEVHKTIFSFEDLNKLTSTN